jgi:hypothetical protein
MSVEIGKNLEFLEQRLSLLRALAQELKGCRKDFIAMDLEGMYRQIAKQEDLCRQIQSLRPEADSIGRTSVLQLDPALSGAAINSDEIAGVERLRAVMRELGKTQAEVGSLNQIHAAFLRRSCKTTQMLINLLGNYAFTYAPATQAPRVAEKS